MQKKIDTLSPQVLEDKNNPLNTMIIVLESLEHYRISNFSYTLKAYVCASRGDGNINTPNYQFSS